RLGNEYLYATVAAANVETLNRYKPKRIVTQCPHCFHNLKNEYPDFGGADWEVLHEGEFIDELIKAGRLKPNKAVPQRITYHDPRRGREVALTGRIDARARSDGTGGGIYPRADTDQDRTNRWSRYPHNSWRRIRKIKASTGLRFGGRSAGSPTSRRVLIMSA